MLRKLIKSIIPGHDKVFLDLLVESTENVANSATILDKLMKESDSAKAKTLVEELRATRSLAINLSNEMDNELDKHFVTPIDRLELHNISVKSLKLNKKIVKIHKFIQILLEEEKESVDSYLNDSVETLTKMTKVVSDMIKALKTNNHKELKSLNNQLNELDENVLDNLAHALKKLSKLEGNVLLIMKIKDIYKAIENSISSCITISESIMRVHVKEV